MGLEAGGSIMRFLVFPFLLLLPLVGQAPATRKPKPPAPVPMIEKPFIVALRAKAMEGQAKAQFDLGVSYAFGQGVGKNVTEAAKWYRKAAEQGYAMAQYNLGVCFDLGKGVSRDHTKAAKWYQKAAQQGHAKAQFNLGVSYKYGQGVPRDYVEAYAWLSLSAAERKKIALKSREEVIHHLSPQELESARERERKLRGEIRRRKVKP
jgi:uncharacterized protein